MQLLHWYLWGCAAVKLERKKKQRIPLWGTHAAAFRIVEMGSAQIALLGNRVDDDSPLQQKEDFEEILRGAKTLVHLAQQKENQFRNVS